MSKGSTDLLVLALDIGSSSTRTALFDCRARRLRGTDATKSYTIRYTPDGGAELSPLTLSRAVQRCVRVSLASQPQHQSRVAALGTSSFWHGLLGLDRAWKPLTPIYTWADLRGSDAARALRKRLSERENHARTGCMLHASFWPAKLTWLRQTQPKMFRRVARWVSPVDWIFHELFGTTVSSSSMASGTGLYNLHRGTWDEKLCAICHVHPSQLPVLRESASPTRSVRGVASPALIFTAIGDGAAGNLGSGAERCGTVAINVGTSAAARMIRSSGEGAKQKVPMGLFQYVVDDDRRVIGGAVSNAGNLRQWALRELRLGKSAATHRLIFARPAAANDTLVTLPFWAGERSPTWPDHQLGVIDGLTQATKAPDILRALNSAVFYRLAQILELIGDGGGPPERIIVSGGILQSMAAVRLLADAIGHDVEIAREQEASLRGAAVHALQQLGRPAPNLPRGILIRHDGKLAAKHRKRRARQIELEMLLRVRDPDLL